MCASSAAPAVSKQCTATHQQWPCTSPSHTLCASKALSCSPSCALSTCRCPILPGKSPVAQTGLARSAAALPRGHLPAMLKPCRVKIQFSAACPAHPGWALCAAVRPAGGQSCPTNALPGANQVQTRCKPGAKTLVAGPAHPGLARSAAALPAGGRSCARAATAPAAQTRRPRCRGARRARPPPRPHSPAHTACRGATVLYSNGILVAHTDSMVGGGHYCTVGGRRA